MSALAAALHLGNLFVGGILSGMEVAFHYGLRRPMEALDDRAMLRLRQALVLRLRVLVPAFFLPTALSGVAVVALDGAGAGLWLRCAAMACVGAWIAIRVVGTVPINSATLAWDLEAPPADWRARVEHAERFHLAGVWAVVVAFGCLLANAALTLPGR